MAAIADRAMTWNFDMTYLLCVEGEAGTMPAPARHPMTHRGRRMISGDEQPP